MRRRTSGFTLFEALFVIFKVSGGIPRKINVLCDTSLVYGFSQGAELITAEIVMEMLRDKARYGVFGAAASSPPVPALGTPRPAGAPSKVADFPSDADSARQLFTTLSDKKK